MNRKIRLLIGVLALQGCLAGVLYVTRNSTGAYQPNESLLNIEAGAFDKITIEEKDKPALTLQKTNDQWILPGHFQFPADPAKIKSIVEKLVDMKKPWPLAETRKAKKLFKVTEKEFEKKITFLKEDKVVQTLLIGTSPGYRKVHVRVPDSSKIYAIEFNTYQASTDPVAWENKDFLHLDRHQVSRIIMPSFTVANGENGFSLQDMQEGQELNENEMGQFITKMTNMSFKEVLGTEEKPAYNQSQPDLQYSVELTTGQKIDYVFSQPKGEDHYVLKPSHTPYYFKFSSPPQKTSADKLTQKK